VLQYAITAFLVNGGFRGIFASFAWFWAVLEDDDFVEEAEGGVAAQAARAEEAVAAGEPDDEPAPNPPR
jgi:hypothetical protein